MVEGFGWDVLYGVNGQQLVNSHADYNFQEQHQVLKSIMSLDWVASCASNASPLAYHYGRFSEANRCVQTMVDIFKKLHDEYTPFDGFNQMLGCGNLPQVLQVNRLLVLI